MTNALLEARVFVSPIQESTGLNTKNVLALSRYFETTIFYFIPDFNNYISYSGVPLVTTPTGAAGLRYVSQNDNETSAFLVANNESEFIDLTLELLQNDDLWLKVIISSY
jgi:hypothetical protein